MTKTAHVTSSKSQCIFVFWLFTLFFRYLSVIALLFVSACTGKYIILEEWHCFSRVWFPKFSKVMNNMHDTGKGNKLWTGTCCIIGLNYAQQYGMSNCHLNKFRWIEKFIASFRVLIQPLSENLLHSWLLSKGTVLQVSEKCRNDN